MTDQRAGDTGDEEWLCPFCKQYGPCEKKDCMLRLSVARPSIAAQPVAWLYVYKPTGKELLSNQPPDRVDYLHYREEDYTITPLYSAPSHVAATSGATCGACGFQYAAYKGHIIPCPRCDASEFRSYVDETHRLRADLAKATANHSADLSAIGERTAALEQIYRAVLVEDRGMGRCTYRLDQDAVGPALAIMAKLDTPMDGTAKP